MWLLIHAVIKVNPLVKGATGIIIPQEIKYHICDCIFNNNNFVHSLSQLFIDLLVIEPVTSHQL